MKVKELIEELSKQDPEASITISLLAMKKIKMDKTDTCGCCNMAPRILIRKNPTFGLLDLDIEQ